MSLVLDGLIIAVALCCVVSGVRQGFVRSLIGLVKGIASLLAAWAYTPVLSEPIKDNYIIRRIAEGIAETLRSLALNLDTNTYDLAKVAADLPEAYTSILERYGIDLTEFTAKIAHITEANEEIIYDYSALIADPCATVIASIVAFGALFLGVWLALSFAAWVVDLIFHLPVLAEANRFAGLIFGAIEAVFFAWIIANVGGSLVTALGPIDTGLFGSHVVDNTVICKFILQNNVFTSITNMLLG